jgi:CRP-like cAMP-binding protein
VAENRRHQTWKLFQDSHLFAAMSNAQKTDIQSIMIKEECKAGQTLAVAGKLGEFSFLVESGKLVDLHKNEIVSSSYRSDITGFIPIVLKGKRYPFTIQAEIDTIVYRIDAMEFKKFLTKNPGVLMHFEKNFKQD